MVSHKEARPAWGQSVRSSVDRWSVSNTSLAQDLAATALRFSEEPHPWGLRPFQVLGVSWACVWEMHRIQSQSFLLSRLRHSSVLMAVTSGCCPQKQRARKDVCSVSRSRFRSSSPPLSVIGWLAFVILSRTQHLFHNFLRLVSKAPRPLALPRLVAPLFRFLVPTFPCAQGPNPTTRSCFNSVRDHVQRHINTSKELSLWSWRRATFSSSALSALVLLPGQIVQPPPTSSKPLALDRPDMASTLTTREALCAGIPERIRRLGPIVCSPLCVTSSRFRNSCFYTHGAPDVAGDNCQRSTKDPPC